MVRGVDVNELLPKIQLYSDESERHIQITAKCKMEVGRAIRNVIENYNITMNPLAI